VPVRDGMNNAISSIRAPTYPNSVTLGQAISEMASCPRPPLKNFGCRSEPRQMPGPSTIAGERFFRRWRGSNQGSALPELRRNATEPSKIVEVANSA
jgi:hypothetical protein